jgi:transposase
MRLLRKQRTQVINRLHTILKKHNLQHDMPAKSLNTAKSQRWLRSLPLGSIDSLERDVLQSQLRQLEVEMRKVDDQLRAMFRRSQPARIVASTPGISVYGGLAIASRLGDIERFANGDSLANFVGLTPSCRNSDATVRHGRVTKLGSSFVRFFLSQGLVHVLRKDRWLRRWYQRIKKRRGGSVARVAVMRRLVTILYAMLRDQMPYVPGGPERYSRLLAMREHQQLSYDQVESLAFHPQV